MFILHVFFDTSSLSSSLEKLKVNVGFKGLSGEIKEIMAIH